MAKAKKGKGRGKAAAKPAKPIPTKKRTSAPRRSGKGGYEIVCSECYSDFTFFSESNATKIHCPECMHSGHVGPADVMSKIAIAKSKERGALVWAIVPAVLFLVCGFTWMAMLTKADPTQLPTNGVNYTFLGVGAVLFIATLALAVRYESNRHEVYF